jgi:hypothetical protein
MHRLRLEGRAGAFANPVPKPPAAPPVFDIPVALIASTSVGDVSGAEVARRAKELLTGTSDISEFLQLQIGPASGRLVDDEASARSVAATEFARRPAIVVFFGKSGDAITAHALLSTVFDAADGSSSLLFPIARYVRSGGGGVQAGDGHLPSWQGIDLDTLREWDPAEIVASTVAAFLLATTDAFWHLRTGLSPNLFARSGIATRLEGFDAAAATPEPPAATVQQGWGRIEAEAGRLVVKGFNVEAEALEHGLIGLHASGPMDVRFVLAADHPRSPPLAVAVDGTEIAIAEEDWSPECSVVDIVEAAWNTRER